MMFRADEMRRLFRPDAFAQLARHDAVDAAVATLDGRRRLARAVQYLDLNTYLPHDILTKVDRMTMAHSVEARPPLLDHRLVEFAATVPARFRLRDGTTKYLSSRRCAASCPTTSSIGRSRALPCRSRKWLREDLAEFARDILLSEQPAGSAASSTCGTSSACSS